MNVDLPIAEPDPQERLRLINAETSERKLDHDADALYAFFHALGRFRPLYKGVTRLTSGPREFALSVSNVPGPRERAVILGHAVEQFCSFAEPADRHALRISVVSLGGRARLRPLLRPRGDLEARRPARRARRLDRRAGGGGLMPRGRSKEYERKRDFSKTKEPSGKGKARKGKAQGARASALLVPEALGHLGALRPAARGRRRAGLLGHSQGALARSPRQATRDADRGPPARVPRVGGRDRGGLLRRGPDDRLGPRRLPEHLRDPAGASRWSWTRRSRRAT